MNRTVIAILLIFIVVLSGCVTQPAKPVGPSPTDLFKQYKDQLKAAYYQGKITWTERTRRVWEYSRQMPGSGTLNDEYQAYLLSIAPQVDAKTMTLDQFSYAAIQKENELNGRERSIDLQERSVAAQELSVLQQERALRDRQKPKAVECRNNYGTVRCEESPY